MQPSKPDYGNWVPRSMMRVLSALLILLLAGEVLLITLVRSAVFCIPGGGIVLIVLALWSYMLRCRVLFDFDRGGLMGRIHQFLVDHLEWDGNGALLDVGCGSGALLIRCAKRFPAARLVGVDSWGAEWSYKKEQCHQNAVLEGVVERVVFRKGDAARLEFPDGTFDAVVSNFVFHEVRSERDKRKVVREALRVLKKGGVFSLQDLFAQEALYGDMEQWIRELRQEGFQEIHYIPYVERLGFVPRYAQAPWMLRGVGLLYGRK